MVVVVVVGGGGGGGVVVVVVVVFVVVVIVVVVGFPRQEVERTGRFTMQTRLSLCSATTRTLLSSSSVLSSPSSV